MPSAAGGPGKPFGASSRLSNVGCNFPTTGLVVRAEWHDGGWRDDGGSAPFASTDFRTTDAGFDPGDPKHTHAVNQLLKDRLINGVKAPDGGMAIALNTGNLTAVRRALRPWYADPRLWMMAVIVGGLGTAGLLLGG
jgi:hypothetical protein